MYCFAIKIEKFRAWIKSSFPPNPKKIHFISIITLRYVCIAQAVPQIYLDGLLTKLNKKGVGCHM